MFKRIVVYSLLALLTLIAPKAVTRPNFVVIMTDDLEGGGTLGTGTFDTMLAAGQLPNIQSRIVSQGTSFRQSINGDSLCCPSRARFFTGQFTHNNHVTANDAANGILQFNASSTLATDLHNSGYATMLVGKYLNSYGGDPTAPVGSPTNPSYVPPGWDYWQGWIDYLASGYTAFQYIVNVNGAFVDHTQFGTADWNYSTDMVATRGQVALNWWQANAPTKPFFLYLAPISPHFQFTDRSSSVINNVCPPPQNGLIAPLSNPGNLFGMTPVPPARYAGTFAGRYLVPQPPNFNEADVSAKPPYVRNQPQLGDVDKACLQLQYTTRMESLKAVDDLVGTIFQKLDALGVTNNTTVIFTSDNGYNKGEHRLTEKQWEYEETIHVPLVIHAAGQTTALTMDTPVQNIDLAPTIDYLAGVTTPRTMDGANIIYYIAGINQGQRKQILLEQAVGGLDGSSGTPPLGNLPYPTTTYVGLRVFSPSNEKYVEFGDGFVELYLLDSDPWELHNVAADPANATEITRLHNLLTTLKTCVGAACRTTEFFGQ